MKIIIVGDGKVGYTLCEQLTREGHDIVVVDNDMQVLEQSVEMLDVKIVHGNGASLRVQQEADAGHSDLLIAATSADEVNILCCVIARKLGCKHTVARMRNPEYAEQLYFLREELGINMTINPESYAAGEIFRLLQLPSFLKRDLFAKGRAEIVEIVLKPDNPLCGQRLSDLSRVVRTRVLVCAVERPSGVCIPNGSFVLEAGDKVYVTASATDLAALVKSLKLQTRKVRTVMIVGGGRIAYYLTVMLLSAGISVKLIELEKHRAADLAKLLPQADVICADGSNMKVLCQEGLEQTDAVVTLTNIDEENLLISMYANHLNVPKVVTKINRTEYTEIIRDMGLDCVISPKLLTASVITGYVRALQNTTGGGVLTLHRMVDDKVEALEFRAGAHTRHLGEKLTDVTLKRDLLVACINRKGRILIPKGDDCIQAGDTVIVVTTAERMFSDLNDIFAEPGAAT